MALLWHFFWQDVTSLKFWISIFISHGIIQDVYCQQSAPWMDGFVKSADYTGESCFSQPTLPAFSLGPLCNPPPPQMSQLQAVTHRALLISQFFLFFFNCFYVASLHRLPAFDPEMAQWLSLYVKNRRWGAEKLGRRTHRLYPLWKFVWHSRLMVLQTII